MAECENVRAMLGAFEDGELESREMHEVARHLAQCRACETELAENAALGRRLRAAAEPPVLDGFVEAVQARIAALTPPLHVRVRRYLASAREQITTAMAFGAAALATAALVALFLTPNDTSNNTSEVANRVTPARVQQTPSYKSSNGIEATLDSPTVISMLESHVPSVAVRPDVAVIWVPDQP